MILADTSIWIDHFRGGDAPLTDIIARDMLLMHPAIIGELALGSLGNRLAVLGFLAAQRQITAASHDEVLGFIEHHALYSMGIGYTDAHLLASVILAPGAALYTRDRRLKAAAEKAGASLFDVRATIN